MILEIRPNDCRFPFVVWGKAKLLQYITPKIPKNIKNYHEIFLGGGSVLLALLSMQKNNEICIENNIYAYDINQPLINTYKHDSRSTKRL